VRCEAERVGSWLPLYREADPREDSPHLHHRAHRGPLETLQPRYSLFADIQCSDPLWSTSFQCNSFRRADQCHRRAMPREKMVFPLPPSPSPHLLWPRMSSTPHTDLDHQGGQASLTASGDDNDLPRGATKVSQGNVPIELQAAILLMLILELT
jgi:hypothetical protein